MPAKKIAPSEPLIDELIKHNIALEKVSLELLDSMNKMTRRMDRMLSLFEEAAKNIERAEKLDEKPIFIENAVRRNPTKPGNCIGVRTDNFKYYRSRSDSKKKVCLYNLKEDPNEIFNIASENSDIVEKMEKLLKNIRKNSVRDEDIDSNETKRIEKDLKPLGKS